MIAKGSLPIAVKVGSGLAIAFNLCVVSWLGRGGGGCDINYLNGELLLILISKLTAKV